MYVSLQYTVYLLKPSQWRGPKNQEVCETEGRWRECRNGRRKDVFMVGNRCQLLIAVTAAWLEQQKKAIREEED